jgi:putative tryptophan/tyrosine transport system substrate-binding protein
MTGRDQWRRRDFIAALGVISAWPLASRADEPRRMRRVGVLHPGQTAVANMRIAAFRDGLRMPGGFDDTHFDVIARITEGDIARLPAMATELVRLDVEALLAVSPPGVSAAVEATRTVPIIGVDLETDPVASGWAASLARPGGNVTGVFLDIPEFSAKCLQTLHEAIPAASKLAILWDPAIGSVQLDAVKRAAAITGDGLEVLEVRRIADLEPAFRAIAQLKSGGVLMLSSPLFSSSTQLLADLARQYRLPAMTLFPDFAQKDGLLAYGPDLQALFRQAGEMTRKVLAGGKAADLPIERPTHFHFIVNLRTANTLGITIPPALLARADEVVE